MPNLHKNSASGKWFSLTLASQLGNVGSEYERAISWKNRQKKDYFQNSAARALELLDLTLSDPRWKNHRLTELAKVREFICDEFNKKTAEQKPGLQKYFTQFAILSRSGK